MSEPVRIVVDPGSHAMLNLGDVAMLQVAVARMLGLWPGARIGVLTTQPDELRRHCPGTDPVPAEGRYEWLGERRPENAARALVAQLAGRGPGARAVQAEARARGVGPEAHAYLEALSRADLFAMSGRGGLTDAFADEADATLGELETVERLGVPAVLLGQGAGPLGDAALRRRAASVLPRVRAISVREARTSERLLRELGVPSARIAVTGDDAVEAASGGGTTHGGGRPRLGVNVRLAPSSGAEPVAEALGAAIRTALRRLGAEPVTVPISLYPGQHDGEATAALTGAEPSTIDTVAGAVAAAGACRAVVTGAYHAGVFAAAHGVPVVALVGSPYYEGKMGGLRDQFGSGVTLVRLGKPGLARRLREAIDFAWATPDDERERMLTAAERRVAAGRAFYARLPGLVGLPAATVGA